MHSIDNRTAARPISAALLKVSFAIGLLTSLLTATSSPCSAAESGWRERYAGYQTAARQDKTAVQAEAELTGPLFAVVSIVDQRISFYGHQGLAARAPISTGARGHPTPTGVFSIVQKKRWHESNIYSSAPMPFMQRITWSGIAMHAGALPGYPASHGCIRLPASFAQRIFGATEIGQRVIVAPRDATPVEIAHKTLPAPLLQPAQVSAADAAAVTAALDRPRSPEGVTLEKVSIADASAEAKPLNPLDFARALKRDATEQARLAARATKAAMLLNVRETTELRLASRRVASAEDALGNAEDRLVAATRKLEKAEAEVAASKAADAKTAEARAVDVTGAETKAVEAKAAETKTAEVEAAMSATAEARAVEAREAEAKLAEAKAAQAQALEAPTADAKLAEANTTQAQAGEAQASEVQPAQASADAVKAAEIEAAEIQTARARAAEAKAVADRALDDMRKVVEEARKTADAAHKAADKARDAAESARRATAKAQRSTENARADIDETQKAAEARAVRLQEAVVRATEARTAAEAAIVEARKAVEDARAAREARQQEVGTAQRAAEEAKAAGRSAARSLAEANRRLKPLSVFISRKTGRLYVRQDFQPLFDAAVAIGDPERPIGTHLFVSTGTTEDGATLKWRAVTMPFLEPEAKDAPRDRKRGGSGDDVATAAPTPAPVAMAEPVTPAAVLDRITIPEETARRLAELTWVGATVIVSDNGISGETGETTDFIILTRSRASAP